MKRLKLRLRYLVIAAQVALIRLIAGRGRSVMIGWNIPIGIYVDAAHHALIADCYFDNQSKGQLVPWWPRERPSITDIADRENA